MGKLILLLITILLLPYVQSQGFTVTSVSTTSVITKTTDPTTVYWILNTQFNGGGQSITGTVDPAMIRGFMGGKAYTKQPLSIEVSSVNEQAFYEVMNEGVPVYKYGLQTFDAPQSCLLGVCAITDNPQPCPSGTNWDIPLGQSFWGKIKKRYCITKQQVGIKGVYNNPLIGFDAKIKLTVGGVSKEKTICSGSVPGCDGSSVSFDDVGVATWSGSLVTGEPAPNQDNFVAIKSLTYNYWWISRKSTFDSYFTKVDITDSQFTQFQTLYSGYNDVTKGDQQINNLLTPINQAADALAAEATSVSFTSSPFTKDDNTGKITVTLSRSLTSPNVVFRIRADWIGVVIPSGQPKILSVTSGKFGSGETGSISVQVQNSGESAGTFSAMLVGCDPFIQSTTTQTSRKTLQPGDVDTILLYVSGGSLGKDVIKTCSVKVYDINDPAVETISSITIQQEEAKICVPNKVFADGNVIKKCNKDGSAIDIVANCKNGVTSDGAGGFACLQISEEKTKYECMSDTDCGESRYCNKEVHACVQKSGCLNVISNGDSARNVDIAFVGDGYLDNEELRRDVLKIVDYEGNNGINGLMSAEPFKSNKNKFNIWMIKAGNKIPVNAYQGPDRGTSLRIAAECTSADYQVVLSKKRFRSYAFFDGDAYLSLSSYTDNRWGRLLLHEFGHSFGKLADEYVEPQFGNQPRSPNCAPSAVVAQTWWGNIPNTAYYAGCSYVETNIRPTFNSIMRAHWILKDDYGEVNRQALLKILNRYG